MLIFLLSMFACLDKDIDSGIDIEIPFAGMDFLLTSSDGYTVVADSVRIGFPRDNEFSLSAGCNSIGGNFSISDDVFSVSMVSMTEMGCDAALMEEDNWLVAFITSSPTYVFDGESLTFSNSEATLVFLDSEIATPDQELVGVTWIVDTFIEGEAAMAYNLSNAPTIAFSTDGTVSIFSGCNSGSGSYEATADSILFSAVAFTEMACDEMEMSAEQHIQSLILEESLSYEIDASRLTISGATIGISANTE